MGLFFRKSKQIGLFRLNASKSGFGLSFGIKGCRLSINPRGIQLNAGVKGTYYRKSVSWNKLKSNNTSVYKNEKDNETKIMQIIITKEQQRFANAFVLTFIITSLLWCFLLLVRLWFLAYLIAFLGFLFNLKLSLTNPEKFKEMVANSNQFFEYKKRGYCVEYKQVENEQKRLEKKYKDYNYSYKNYQK